MRHLGFIALSGLFVAVSACQNTDRDPVVDLVKESSINNGQVVSVVGILRANKGYFNLHSKRGDECVGLQVAEDDVDEFKGLVGKSVNIQGRFEAEGCGRDGICVEHLCGPAIIARAQLER